MVGYCFLKLAFSPNSSMVHISQNKGMKSTTSLQVTQMWSNVCHIFTISDGHCSSRKLKAMKKQSAETKTQSKLEEQCKYRPMANSFKEKSKSSAKEDTFDNESPHTIEKIT